MKQDFIYSDSKTSNLLILPEGISRIETDNIVYADEFSARSPELDF